MSGFLNNNFKTIFIISKSHFKQQIRKCNTLHKVQFENASNIEDTNSSQKLLRVAVIGMPNAGKSTFINHLMDRKVCPTSSKVHTTRTKARAIFTDNDAQIIFLDTPGLITSRIQKRHKLENSFLKDSDACLKQADTIGVIHDVSNVWTREQLDIKIINLLENHISKPSFLVLNKIDVLKSKRKLLEITRLITMNCVNGKAITRTKGKFSENASRGWPNFKDIFMVSSLSGSGLSDVKNYLIKSAKPHNWLYPADMWTDQTPEKIIINTVKATLLDFLPQEIPYELKPEIELLEIDEDGVTNTVVLVKCPSDRIAKLVAGASDGRLRQIIEKTQMDLQSVFQQFIRIRIILQSPK